ncbi:hypothetical protein WMF38_57250 [Sorangium sp. So ce118]
MRPLLMAAALLTLPACPFTVTESLPCSPCKMKCEQDFGDSCDNCRAENCPDMGDAATDNDTEDPTDE